MKTLIAPALILATLVSTACTLTPEAQERQLANADKICRKVELIGTRFGKTECRSSSEWDAFDKATAEGSNEMVNDIQRTQSGSAPGAPG